MRIVGIVQGFAYGRGRATTMVELLTPLAAAGHTVDVFVSDAVALDVTPGVRVRPLAMLDHHGARYDVVIYNSGLAPATLDKVRMMQGKKLLCQHSYLVTEPGLRFANAIWFPSRAAMKSHDKMARMLGHRFVVPPPIDPDRYRTPPGDKIGLSLSSPWKGGYVAAEMARAMPEHPFLVVKDGRGHGTSLFKGLPNVELVDFLPPRDFYAQTRVQIFPSKSETYGRVAVEGAISGIPLVASPDRGIREAMGGHGIYIDRKDNPAWVRAVTRLMTDEDAWVVAARDVAIRGAEAVTRYPKDRQAFVAQVEALGGRK